MIEFSSSASKLKVGWITKSLTSLIYVLRSKEHTLKISFKIEQGPSMKLPQLSLSSERRPLINIPPTTLLDFPKLRFTAL